MSDEASDPLEDSPFDRGLRRVRRDRAARYAETHPLLERMADELVERLRLTTRSFSHALDLGCGPGMVTRRLRMMGMEVAAADAGQRFAAAGYGVQCDEDRLPFPPASFDLAASVGVLDQVNDLPGALVQVRRALRPDGLFLASLVGAGSLPRLRAAMRAADEEMGGAAPHLHPQIDLRAAGDLLGRAGFALPVVDVESVTVRYRSLGRLVDDLRQLGWTNLLATRSRRPLTRRAAAAAAASFEAQADADGRVSERFEIVHLSGWAPSPDQPKPARRGSASHSLAQALGQTPGGPSGS